MLIKILGLGERSKDVCDKWRSFWSVSFLVSTPHPKPNARTKISSIHSTGQHRSSKDRSLQGNAAAWRNKSLEMEIERVAEAKVQVCAIVAKQRFAWITNEEEVTQISRSLVVYLILIKLVSLSCVWVKVLAFLDPIYKAWNPIAKSNDEWIFPAVLMTSETAKEKAGKATLGIAT